MREGIFDEFARRHPDRPASLVDNSRSCHIVPQASRCFAALAQDDNPAGEGHGNEKADVAVARGRSGSPQR
jgi:hypothetical protein